MFDRSRTLGHIGVIFSHVPLSVPLFLARFPILQKKHLLLWDANFMALGVFLYAFVCGCQQKFSYGSADRCWRSIVLKCHYNWPWSCSSQSKHSQPIYIAFLYDTDCVPRFRLPINGTTSNRLVSNVCIMTWVPRVLVRVLGYSFKRLSVWVDYNPICHHWKTFLAD